MSNIDEKLLLRAIGAYGVESQMRMLQEECCELAHAVSKFLRRRDDDHQLESEIADVLIMIAQVRLILALRNENHDDGIQLAIDRKMKRLSESLAKQEAADGVED